MINDFKNILNKKFSFLKDSKLLLTVSGGIDSVVLTHLLHQLDFNISIAHVNFHLRGEDSDLDEQFVNELASTLDVPFYITPFDTKQHAKEYNLSIQEAARNLRYKWFEEIRVKHNFDYILTAHNLNDSLETFLINLSRGTGLKGLTGINNINGKIIRPLSDFSRNEIEIFAFISNIKWRDDKSNAQTKYTRNKIRHNIIPILQEINPNLLDSFKQTLENLQGSEAIIDDKISEIRNKSQETVKENRKLDKFNIKFLLKLNNLKAYLFELFSPYGFTNINDIHDLLTAQSGKQVFSKTYRLVKDRELLLLEEIIQQPEVKSQQSEVFLINGDNSTLNIKNLTLKIEHFDIIFRQKMRSNKNIAQFDKDLLKFPLTVRKWQNGDYFYPIGMNGKKKLSKFFKDEKISIIDKENIWLLLSDNKIVWIIGMRQDERFKITDTTNNITKISTF